MASTLGVVVHVPGHRQHHHTCDLLEQAKGTFNYSDNGLSAFGGPVKTTFKF